MEFGVFDHLDKNDRPLARYYSERLELIAAYERAGFYAYHVAEHHLTDLGMAPSPSVFLAAVAARTTRLRFGPMIFAAPLYHPLRLLQEICMLDQLSGGRLEIGFGRLSQRRAPPLLVPIGEQPQIAAVGFERVFRKAVLEPDGIAEFVQEGGVVRVHCYTRAEPSCASNQRFTERWNPPSWWANPPRPPAASTR